MNERIQQLAAQAGFVFWGSEHWGPGPGHIDWGADYDSEMAEFVRLLTAEFSNSKTGVGNAAAALQHHPQHSHTLAEMYAELHFYEEINEHYAQCDPGAANLRDWVAERMPQPVQPITKAHFEMGFPEPCLPPTMPVQRQWVGLTDEERRVLWKKDSDMWGDEMTYAEAIEAKLKEKNT